MSTTRWTPDSRYGISTVTVSMLDRSKVAGVGSANPAERFGDKRAARNRSEEPFLKAMVGANGSGEPFAERAAFAKSSMEGQRDSGDPLVELALDFGDFGTSLTKER